MHDRQIVSISSPPPNYSSSGFFNDDETRSPPKYSFTEENMNNLSILANCNQGFSRQSSGKKVYYLHKPETGEPLGNQIPYPGPPLFSYNKPNNYELLNQKVINSVTAQTPFQTLSQSKAGHRRCISEIGCTSVSLTSGEYFQPQSGKYSFLTIFFA